MARSLARFLLLFLVLETTSAYKINLYCQPYPRCIWIQLELLLAQIKPPSDTATVATQILPRSKCGLAPLDNAVLEKRIVGGANARQHSHPWVVRLVTQGQTFCGATLICDTHVVTAAHCVIEYQQRPHHLKLVLGDHDQFNDNEAQHQDKSVTKISIHPKYSSVTKDNDIAVLKFASPVAFQDHIQPACLPSSDLFGDDHPSRSVWALGWGRQSYYQTSQILKEVKLKTLSSKKCINETKYTSLEITTNMICARAHQMDSCQGDSGGPLMLRTDGRWELHGIVSWGKGCGEYMYPGVYVKVFNYLAWIKKMTQN